LNHKPSYDARVNRVLKKPVCSILGTPAASMKNGSVWRLMLFNVDASW
jgi:hypothetical protein